MQIEPPSSPTGTVLPNTFSVRSQILQSLRTGKEYRHSFVEEKIRTGLAVQTKAIRESNDGMTQQCFAKKLGKSQSWVARLENPNSSLPTLTTLLKVAETFDVDLVVRYAPFSETADWVSGNSHIVPGLSPESLAVPDFEHDTECLERINPSREENVPALLPDKATGTLGAQCQGQISARANIIGIKPCEVRELQSIRQGTRPSLQTQHNPPLGSLITGTTPSYVSMNQLGGQ